MIKGFVVLVHEVDHLILDVFFLILWSRDGGFGLSTSFGASGSGPGPARSRGRRGGTTATSSILNDSCIAYSSEFLDMLTRSRLAGVRKSGRRKRKGSEVHVYDGVVEIGISLFTHLPRHGDEHCLIGLDLFQ